MIRTGNKNFWIAQLVGWGTFAIANFAVQYIATVTSGKQEISAWYIVLNSIIGFTGGILITTGYRYFIKRRRLNLLKFSTTIFYILSSTVILTLLFLCFVNLLLLIFNKGRLLSTLEFFSNFFIFGILMLIWNSLYFMIHYLHNWKNAETEKWQLKASIREAELGKLKAQINPHFMFNAINNIRALISEDQQRAKDMLLNFSDMFRYSLVHGDQQLVTIEEEIEVVKKYLELLKIQFEEKLRHEIIVEAGLAEMRIPPMILQLLVENAVKHGISELKGGGLIKVNVASRKDSLLFEVINSGEISEQHNIQGKLGVGLQNIRERLKLIYGQRAELNLLSGGGLVTASVLLPKSVSL